MRTREEHLAWCKQRALEYVDAGKLDEAVASMASDMNQHPGTRHVSDVMLRVGLLYLDQGDPQKVRMWVEGFR